MGLSAVRQLHIIRFTLSFALWSLFNGIYSHSLTIVAHAVQLCVSVHWVAPVIAIFVLFSFSYLTGQEAAFVSYLNMNGYSHNGVTQVYIVQNSPLTIQDTLRDRLLLNTKDYFIFTQHMTRTYMQVLTYSITKRDCSCKDVLNSQLKEKHLKSPMYVYIIYICIYVYWSENQPRVCGLLLMSFLYIPEHLS